MAQPIKMTENLKKHLTKAEIETRKKFEQDMERKIIRLRAPDYIKANERALDYWKKTVARMKGIALLDDVDTDTLGGYCDALATRDALRDEAEACDYSDERLQIIKTKQTQERLILAYAEKLGLTPAGRARLAKQKATERPVEADGDLFGD